MEHGAIVFIEANGETIPAGKIRILEDGRYSRSEFAYGRKYLERRNAVAIDPVQLPLTDRVIRTPEHFALFNGIRDAAPDAWGRALIDRYVMRLFGRPAGEAEYLLASQSGNRVGALRFGATPDTPGKALDFWLPEADLSLGELSLFQEMVDSNLDEGILPERYVNLLSPGTDLGGARPKATVLIDGFPWLAKFAKDGDRICNAAAEAGCLDLCEMAGLEVCERQIVEIAGNPTLLLKRFDREILDDGKLARRHMISSLSLLGMHESDNGLSGYADIYDSMRRHASGPEMGLDIYKRMLMNVLCGNTDDHYRNHAFLLDENGKYRSSPVYDVSPTLQAGYTRNLFLHLGKAGSGREATLEAAVKGAPSLGVARDDAICIANELSDMVASNWEKVMRGRGASENDLAMLSNAFNQAGRKIEVDDPDAMFPGF